MTINARAGINGNSLQDFFNVYLEITMIQDLIDNLEGQLRANVVHGRNYQHLNEEAADDALIDDRRFVHETLQKARANVSVLASAISDATDGWEG